MLTGDIVEKVLVLVSACISLEKFYDYICYYHKPNLFLGRFDGFAIVTA